MSCGRTRFYDILALALAGSCAHCGARSELRVWRDAASEHTRNACDGGAVPASIQITTDDNDRLYVNGQLVDATPRAWTSPQRYALDLAWGSARNVIAVEGTNTMNVDGLDRGVLVDVSFSVGGRERHIVSDTRWRLSTLAVSNWFRTDFDASAWRHAISEGVHGIAPWGPVFGSSDAQWIWSYVADQSAASKPVRETIWIRRDFFLDANGDVFDEPPGC